MPSKNIKAHLLNMNQKIDFKCSILVMNDDNLAKLVKCQSVIRIWLINRYLDKVKVMIHDIIRRDAKPFIYEPTLFGDNSKKNIKYLRTAFIQRQKQMKEGEIAQMIIGNFIGWTDLRIGHPSGLDCIRKDKPIVMEVKNKWNTCNSGSKEALLIKLSRYKKENPHTRCVWAIVNEKPGCNKLHEEIVHDGCVIEKIQGSDLFKLVFTIGNIDYSMYVIRFVKKIINEEFPVL